MFMSLLAAAGTAEDRSPFGDFWFSPIPYRTGGPLETDAALRLSAVYACVRVRAEAVAMLPFTIYRMLGSGGREFSRDHWLYRLFAVRPNAWQNPFEFREMLNGHLDLRGNAYAEIYPDGTGGVSDLVPIHPDCVTLELLSSGGYRFRVRRPDGSTEYLNRAQMFHLRGLSLDGMTGLNPIAVQREMLAGGLAAQGYASRFWENDARPPGWIEFEGEFRDKDARDRFRQQWQENQAGANRGKIALLDRGMKFHSVELSNADAQFIEYRKMTRSEIASLWRVPPHMIGDLEKATFSNIEQQAIEFVTNCLTPLLVRWEEAIKFHFLDPVADPADADVDVEFPTRELLRGDTKARSEYAASGIINGWLTRNEARLDDGRMPLAGLDAPLVPLNMTEEGADPPPGSSPPAPDNTPGGPKQPSRAEQLARAAAARVARKEAAGIAKAAGDPAALAAFFDAHARFVAQALAVDEELARAHCVIAAGAVVRGTHTELWAAQQLARVALLVESTKEAAA